VDLISSFGRRDILKFDEQIVVTLLKIFAIGGEVGLQIRWCRIGHRLDPDLEELTSTRDELL